MDEMTFYNHEAVAELASTISVAVTDTFKYICTNYTSQANKEDFKYFEDELLRAAFHKLRDDCLEFVQSYDYYNFTSSTPFPAEKDSAKAIMERTKAFMKAIERNSVSVLVYEEAPDYYDLVELIEE